MVLSILAVQFHNSLGFKDWCCCVMMAVDCWNMWEW